MVAGIQDVLWIPAFAGMTEHTGDSIVIPAHAGIQKSAVEEVYHLGMGLAWISGLTGKMRDGLNANPSLQRMRESKHRGGDRGG